MVEYVGRSTSSPHYPTLSMVMTPSRLPYHAFFHAQRHHSKILFDLSL